MGVDVFFVISGYLITQILLKDYESGLASLPRFWERRARRILPALCFLLVVISALAGFLYLPIELKRFGQEVFAQAIFSSNILFFMTTGGYFDPGAETRTLLHTWSLSVEEQFYILYPLLFFTLIQRSRAALAWAIFTIVVASLVTSILIAEDYKEANFYLLPTRAWELGLGCLLAMSAQLEVPKRLIEPLALIGLLMIIISVNRYDAKTIFPGATALLPCLGTAFLLKTGQFSRWTGGILKIPSVVGVGKFSYSLYLWHWPLLVLLGTTMIEPPTMSQKLTMLLISFFAAWISWRWIELPFRQKTALKARRHVFAGALAGVVIVGSVGLVFHFSSGLPARWSPEVLQIANGEKDRNPRRGVCRNLSPEEIQKDELCALGNLIHVSEPTVVVWGDSHADAMQPAFDALANDQVLGGWIAAKDACLPIISEANYVGENCGRFNESVINWISTKEVDLVILVARWAAYSYQPNLIARDLGQTIEMLESMNVDVWVMRQLPEHKVSKPGKLARILSNNEDLVSFALSRSELLRFQALENLRIESALSDSSSVIDPSKEFCQNGKRCELTRNGKAIYVDEHHISRSAALMLKGFLKDSLMDQFERQDKNGTRRRET